MSRTPGGRVVRATFAAALTAALVLPASLSQARTVGYASDLTKPDAVAIVAGFRTVWRSSGADDKHGKVLNAAQLAWNDRVVSWINQHATRAQKFRALQDAENRTSGAGYDQSITIADGLGKRLGAFYAKGRINGSLPLTAKLVDTTDGSAGHYLGTKGAKAVFSYPRPYLKSSARAGTVGGDSSACAPSRVNASSLAALRKGKPWVTAHGNLRITRVPSAMDTTRAFAATDVALDAGYGKASLCLGGSFPSGHATAAYSAGLTLATLLPELAPSILARTSEAANNRIVLGVHYPLDVIGGRMVGEAAVAARWSDKRFRDEVLKPARDELVTYLEQRCGGTLAVCIASDTPYANDPYAGRQVPRGGNQAVIDRISAVAAYTARLSYGFAAVGLAGLGASVPRGAENLLRTCYPTLTAAQRRAVLAQTETSSGNTLDTTAPGPHGSAGGSWQRLNLAAAMSASVLRMPDGNVVVLSVGDQPSVTDA